LSLSRIAEVHVMQRATKTQANQQHGPAATARISQPSAASLVDKRPQTIAQRELLQSVYNSPKPAVPSQLAEAIDNSPKMLAQRMKLQSLFGEASQPKETPEGAELLQGKLAVARRELASAIPSSPHVIVQRQQARGAFSNTLQREGPKQEELLQSKLDLLRHSSPAGEELQMRASLVPAQLRTEALPRYNDTGLPDSLKSGIETLSGISMDNVNVHYNSSQPARLNALAYAQGREIHVAPGQERHLPHEAWHLVQQAQDRVKPTLQLNGTSVNDDSRLEAQASHFGAQALSLGSRAPAATTRPQTLTQEYLRSSQSFLRALPASLQSIAQLAGLPANTTGQLGKIKIREGTETETTAKDLQINLIKKLSEVGKDEVKSGFGYRLISLIYDSKRNTYGLNRGVP
jgi:hypothetical protein